MQILSPPVEIGSGNIWDKVDIPQGINPVEKTRLEAAWKDIPKKFTDGINKLTIRQCDVIVSGGLYTPTADNGNIDIKLGKSCDGDSTLHHEVHHHMWRHKRAKNQIILWKIGVDELMKKYGKSPSRYSDSWASNQLKIINKLKSDAEKLKIKIDANKININMIFPDYRVSASLLRDIRRYGVCNELEMVKKAEAETKITDMKKRFGAMSAEEKMAKAASKHAELEKEYQKWKDRMIYGNDFYDESHSAVGEYIYAEQSTRKRAATLYVPSWPKYDHRVNDDVIDEYVKLYMKVFC